MANYELDYYLIQSDDNFTAPMLVGDYEVENNDIDFINTRRKAENVRTRYLAFTPPIPRKPAMIDYLYFRCRVVTDNLSNKKCVTGAQSHSGKITNNNRAYFKERINI